MDEFRFVLKCFAFSALFLVLTQIKAGDRTIENHIQSSLVNSKVSNFLNKTADGGVKLIKDSYHYAMDSYQDWKSSENSKPTKLNEVKNKESSVRAKTEPSSEEDAGLIEVLDQ